MRLFTGIALGDEVRENVLKELKPFRKAGAPLRFTDDLNLHLTLKFIGEVAEPVAARVGAALEALPPMPPFRLCLRGFGKFPAGDGLNILWAGVEASPELRALFDGMEDALAPLGIGRDARPFHPHVTLGRGKARSRRGGNEFNGVTSLLREKSDVFLGEWRVAAYRLYSSRLTPEGPFYTVLKEIPLVES
jgi:2'-5' RNA ligase